MSVTKLQDMPPSGGYNPINFKKVPQKTILKAWWGIPLFTMYQIGGVYVLYQRERKLRREKVENRSAFLALVPLYYAEKDRATLKVLHKNREVERELMKNVPNWEVGKYYDESIFNTVDEDAWFDPWECDFYVFDKFQNFRKHYDFDTYASRGHYY